jgi:3-oxoacyl-[acyl-carrier-protein] synthase III
VSVSREARRPAGVLGLGVALPERVVASADVAARLGIGEDWIVSRTGVGERRVADPDDRLSSLATRAALAATADAGVDADQVELVCVATITADELTPGASSFVAGALGARRAGAFDLGAACNGFVTGLALASAAVENGTVESAVVVGADLMSRLLDHDDRRTAPLFGDGASALLIGAAGSGSVGRFVLRSDGSGTGRIYATRDEATVRMDGYETFKSAVARLSEVTEEVCAANGLRLADVDLFVYHQANGRITSAVGERLGLPAEKVVDCIERFGNTSAATIPLALAVAGADGRLEPGATVLVAAFGAGFVWGGGILRWRASAGG